MHSISTALTWPWMQEFVNTYGWLWPLFEVVHYTGMSLVVGVVIGLDLRILGLYKAIPSAPSSRWSTWPSSASS